MKKKILVIFTGGTIGSEQTGRSVGLNTASRRLLLSKYAEKYATDVQFDALSPINILSENVQKEDLYALYDCVKGVDACAYDGIIVTHGTDTLCFTVNWFSQVFCNYPLPIVFVSALYPLSDKRSNGLDNFAAAVTFIEKTGLKGVYCAFRNDGERAKIHLGSRLIWPDEITGFYHSAKGACFAETENGQVLFSARKDVPAPEEIAAHDSRPVPPLLSDRVLHITMRALLNFEMFDFFRNSPRAVVAELSHSGTICTKGDELNFITFAKNCNARNIPVIIAPVMSSAGVYSSMSDLPACVKVAHDITVEMTLVKVMAALGAGLAADAYLDDNLFFEKL